MCQLRRSFAVVVLCGAFVGVSFAASPPNQASLDTCQKTVKSEGAKFVKAEIAAIGACLQKISSEVIRNGAAIDTSAARTCITQLRKIYDTRGAGKSLVEKLTLKIRQKCDPSFNPALALTIDDITGKGSPTVPTPIDTLRLDLYCGNFGGDGSIDSVPEWINCIVAAHQCEANEAIALQYPHAPEWLRTVKPIMLGIPAPPSDPNKSTDAATGAMNVSTAIDSDGNNIPDISCPQAAPAPVCSTACCYIEQSLGTLKPTACFEYTGSAGEVSTFKTQCGGKQDSTGTQWVFTAVNGACSAGPTYSVTCKVGTGNNAVAIPKDATCP